MYGKIFDSIYDGTLYGNWEAIATLQQFIVLATPEGIVDMTPQAIAARTSFPLDLIQRGIEFLSKPDPYTRTPGEEGKRIVLLDEHRPWGWRLVNHGKYARLRNIEQKRQADRDRISEKRKQNKDVAIESHPVANVAHSDSDKDLKQAAAKDAALDPIWGEGLNVLLQGGVQESQARSFIGLQLASWKPQDVLEAIQAAAGKADVRGYVRGVLRTKPKKNESAIKVDL